jgi:peptide/nickel transport system substrate-binding protein
MGMYPPLDPTKGRSTRVAARRRYLPVVALTAVALGLVFAAGAVAKGGRTAAHGGGTLTVRLQADYPSLDPSGPTGTPPGSQFAVPALYDRLVAPGAKGTILPYLAASWKVSPSAKAITFKLKSGIVCSDGTPLTATAVANSLRRFFKSPNAAFALSGGPYTASGKNSAGSVTVTFTHPSPDGIYGFASPFSSIICPAGLKNAKALKEGLPKGASTGAYTIASAKHGVGITFKKNPLWKWGPHGLTAADLPDKLVANILTNETTAANSLLTGKLSGGQVNGADVPRLLASPSLTKISTSSAKVWPLVMNQTDGHATSDPQVRRAIMTAIDPKSWGQAGFPAGYVLGPSLFAPSAPCYDPTTAKLVPKFDVTEAKRILTAAGYTVDGSGHFAKNGTPLSITVLGTPALTGQGTQYLGAQLASIGLNVTIHDYDLNAFGADYIGGKWDVAVATTSVPNPAPSTFMSILSGPLAADGGTNYAYITDPQLTTDVNAAYAAVGSASCPAWKKVQRTGLTDNDWLPLAAPITYFFAQKGVTVDMFSTSYFETETMRKTS